MLRFLGYFVELSPSKSIKSESFGCIKKFLLYYLSTSGYSRIFLSYFGVLFGYPKSDKLFLFPEIKVAALPASYEKEGFDIEEKDWPKKRVLLKILYFLVYSGFSFSIINLFFCN